MSDTANDYMVVRRIHTERGSHIEPPANERWDDLTQLRWQAAIVEADTGLRLRVRDGAVRTKRRGRWVEVPGMYSVQVGASARCSGSFSSTYDFLSGVAVGALEQARRIANGDEDRSSSGE